MFSPKVKKALSPFVPGRQMAQLDALTAKYANGGTPESYVKAATKIVGKDVVAGILPDLVGALPSGEQKSALFRYYSTSL